MFTKTFTEIAKENGFDDINETDDEKFSTIKDYTVNVYKTHEEIGFVDNLDHPHIPNVSDIDHHTYLKDKAVEDVTVCYTLWQNPLYVKLLYLSFLSQVLYSDILNVKKFVVVTDYKLEPLVWDVFRPLAQAHSENFELEVKAIDRQRVVWSDVAPNVRMPVRLNKYVVSTLDELRETDLLVLSDCESFIYGKRGQIYKQLYSQYSESDNFPVLGCEETLNKNKSVFLERREDLANMIHDDEEYINWCAKRLGVSKKGFINKVVKRDNWFLTCWFVFDNEKYKPSSSKWQDYVEWSSLYSMYCDESIYLTYGWCAEDYQVKDVDFVDGLKFIHSPQCKNFFKRSEYKKTGIVHPLHGRWAQNFWVQDFYDSIQDEFEVKLKQAMDEEVSFRELLPQYQDSFYTEPIQNE